MFGYVSANKPELKMKEYYKYKAYYCGLCRTLKEKYGFLGQLTLTYDMTFLVILLTSLYESETRRRELRCALHPVKKQKILQNEITGYAADMNVLLTYYKLLDDWKDEKSKVGLAGIRVFHKTFLRLKEKYPKKCEVIRKSLALLQQCETRGEESIDVASRYFGELMGELFVYKEDVWSETLRKMGFYLGKFIYLLDAYDDVDKDIEANSYNVLMPMYADKDFDRKCEEMLTYILAECTCRFEKLPCVEDVEILRNILYAGVWDKFYRNRKGKDSE